MFSPLPNKSNSIRPPSLPKSHTKNKPDHLNAAHTKSFQSLKQVTPHRPLPGRRTSVVKSPITSATKNGTSDEPILIESLEATPNQDALTSQKKPVKYLTIEDTPENKDKVQQINESFSRSAACVVEDMSEKWNNDSVIEQEPSIIEDFIPPMTQEKHAKHSRTKENFSNIKVNKNLSLNPEDSVQEIPSQSNNLSKNTLLSNIIPEDEPSENRSPLQQGPNPLNYGFSISLSPSQQFNFPNLNSTGKDTSRFGGSPELRSPVALDRPLGGPQDAQKDAENDAGSDATSNLLSHIDDCSLFPNEISFAEECENFQTAEKNNTKKIEKELGIFEADPKKPSLIPTPEDLRRMNNIMSAKTSGSLEENKADNMKKSREPEKDFNSSSLFDLSQNFLETKKPSTGQADVEIIEQYKPDPFGGVAVESSAKKDKDSKENVNNHKMEIETKDTKTKPQQNTVAKKTVGTGLINKENKEKKGPGQSILKPNEAYKYFDRKLQKPSEEKQKPTSSVDKQPHHPPVNPGRTSQGKPLQDSKSNNIVNKPIIPQNKPSVTIKSSFGSVPKGLPVRNSVPKSPSVVSQKSTMDKLVTVKAVSSFSLNRIGVSNGKRGWEELQPGNGKSTDEKYQTMKKLKPNEGNSENLNRVSKLQADPSRGNGIVNKESVNSKGVASNVEDISMNLQKTNGMKSGKNCVYCGLELESKTGNKMLSCLHKAHMSCFTTLERRKKTSCPMCNSNMTPMNFGLLNAGTRSAACKF